MQQTVWVHLVTAAGEAEKKGILDLLADATGVVMGTLVLLLLFSVISWYIIGYKFFYLRRAHSESLDFMDTFWQSKRLDSIYQAAQGFKRSPVSQVFKAGYIELTKLKGQASGAVPIAPRPGGPGGTNKIGMVGGLDPTTLQGLAKGDPEAIKQLAASW